MPSNTPVSVAAACLVFVMPSLFGGVWADDADRLAVLNRHVLSAYQEGDYHHGILWARQALALAQDQLGAQHPRTLTFMNNLAALYKAQGLLEKAEPLLEQTLKARRVLYGDDHPKFLNAMHNLAALYYAQRRYAEARRLFEETLRSREALLGSTHPDTLSTRRYVAKVRGVGEEEGVPFSLAPPAPPVEGALSTAQRVATLISKARQNIVSLRLTSPEEDNAVDKLRQVLLLDPGNEEALANLRKVAETYVDLAKKVLTLQKVEDAEGFLVMAERIAPGLASIQRLRDRLRRD